MDESREHVVLSGVQLGTAPSFFRSFDQCFRLAYRLKSFGDAICHQTTKKSAQKHTKITKRLKRLKNRARWLNIITLSFIILIKSTNLI